jgi:restriction system protein
MPIPDFQSIMLPLLRAIADGRSSSYREVVDLLADEFKLTKEERKALHPNGVVNIFYNRVAWAKTDLQKAGLIESIQRGSFQITPAGIQLLKKPPEKINRKFLMQFENFNKYQDKSKQQSVDIDDNDHIKTPEEYIEEGYNTIKQNLSIELLEMIKSCSAKFFEILVVDLLLKMGYGGSRLDAGRAIGQSRDGGIDGIINEDKLGLDIIYIQAKKWNEQVPVKEIRDFAGALLGKKAKKGIFITTSGFPKSAYDYVSGIEHKIILIDGEKLTDLMIEHNVGVTVQNSYEIKKMDTDYFSEE